MIIENFVKKYRVIFIEIAFLGKLAAMKIAFYSHILCFVLVTMISVHLNVYR